MRSWVRFPALPCEFSLKGKDSRGDHGLCRLVEFRFKAAPGTNPPLSPLTHHRDNVTAPHGRPNLRSRLHSCHAQEGGPRSPQRHVVALGKEEEEEEEEEEKEGGGGGGGGGKNFWVQ